MAQHIIQRGVDRGVCFCDNFDRELYLAILSEVAWEHDCVVHAYVLMTNHVTFWSPPDAPVASRG
ncbi:MAG: hypothetical protein V2I63_02615 [Pseudomonadales bacterium]|nr:hypothetical protein [Pseudomonadales bacterium]